MDVKGLMKYKDKNGTVYVLRPITSADNIEGLTDVLSVKADQTYVDNAIAAIELTPGPAGADGSPGADGQDGVSVTHSWDGTILTLTSASGTSSVDLQGPAGADGSPGADGKDGDPGSCPIVAGESTDGVTYTATLEDVTEFTVGLTVMLIPEITSTSTTPTLNLNGFGAKIMRLALASYTSSTLAPANAGFFAAGKPVQLTYNGTFWVTSIVRPAASDLYGVLPVANGGVPESTTDNNGQFLRVLDGVPAWSTITNAEDLTF